MDATKNYNPFAGLLRVRSCAIIIQDQRLLLVNQKAPTRTEPIWLPPGGGVHAGESAEIAVKRELKEELNIEIDTERLLFVHEFIEAPYHAVEFYFKAEIQSGEIKLGMDPELTNENQQLIRFDFVCFNKLKNLPVYPEFLREITIDMTEAESGISYHKSVK